MLLSCGSVVRAASFNEKVAGLIPGKDTEPLNASELCHTDIGQFDQFKDVEECCMNVDG